MAGGKNFYRDYDMAERSYSPPVEETPPRYDSGTFETQSQTGQQSQVDSQGYEESTEQTQFVLQRDVGTVEEETQVNLLSDCELKPTGIAS
jgi:hypothetical protein